MRTITKLLAIYFIATFQLFCSCKNASTDKSNAIKEGNTFKGSLTEKQIGKSNFYISLPPDYSIKESNGPDFSVYYFSPSDTTVKANFAGGLYFGNFPHEFEPDNDSCKTSTVESKILDRNASWTVYNCDSNYTLQTIVDSKSGEDWNDKIHAFGNAKFETDMGKVLDIYTTLKQKK